MNGETIHCDVHVHPVSELAGIDGASMRKGCGTAERAAAYMASEGLRELWREAVGDTLHIHCVRDYGLIVLRVKGKSSPHDERFYDWRSLAAHMEANGLLFADGSEPCASLGEFLARCDVDACCDMDDHGSGRIRLLAVKRPR